MDDEPTGEESMGTRCTLPGYTSRVHPASPYHARRLTVILGIGPPAMRGRLRPRPESLTTVLTRPFIETRLGVPRLVSINNLDNQPRVTLTKCLYLIYTESRRSRDEVHRELIVEWRAEQASHDTARLPGSPWHDSGLRLASGMAFG